ncbi:MAG: MlaC/ttg2D family ABC transporter substrate-binding protein [Gammaproteobacteria bacterium]
MRLLLVPAIAFACLATGAWAAGADTAAPGASAASPAAVIQRASSRVLDALNENKAKLKDDPALANELVRKYLLPDFDFDLTSQLVLGRYWRAATPAQRKDFEAGFLHYLTSTYAKGLQQFNGAKIEVLPFRGDADGKYVRVRSRLIIPDHEPIEVDYALTKVSGDWKVFDIIIAGISYVKTYQGEFQSEVRRTSLAALIKRLQNAQVPATVTAMKAATPASGGR